MENLIIKEVPDMPFYPEVNFDADSGLCEISGESYMEETYQFYTPLLDWLKTFIEEKNQPIIFNFKLTYFNTSSSKLILDIIDLMKTYNDSEEGKAKINWYYDTNDPDMEDEVEDFVIESGMKINLVSLE